MSKNVFKQQLNKMELIGRQFRLQDKNEKSVGEKVLDRGEEIVEGIRNMNNNKKQQQQSIQIKSGGKYMDQENIVKRYEQEVMNIRDVQNRMQKNESMREQYMKQQQNEGGGGSIYEILMSQQQRLGGMQKRYEDIQYQMSLERLRGLEEYGKQQQQQYNEQVNEVISQYSTQQKVVNEQSREFSDEKKVTIMLLKDDTGEKRKLNEIEILDILRFYEKAKREDEVDVSKEEIILRLYDNVQLMSHFNVDPEVFPQQIRDEQTRDSMRMTVQELMEYMRIRRGVVPEQKYLGLELIRYKMGYKDNRLRLFQKGRVCVCLLRKEDFELMRNKFEKLDQHKDMKLLRQKYIYVLRQDKEVISILNKPAVYIATLDRSISMNRVLLQISQEEYTGPPYIRQQKQYIMWKQFQSYFKNYRKPPNEYIYSIRMKQEEDDNVKSKTPNDEDDIELSRTQFRIIQDVYDNEIKKENSFVELGKFIKNLKNCQKFQAIMNQIGRVKAKKHLLHTETILQVINRMEIEADSYIQWEDILEFFTKLGRPRNLVEELNRKEAYSRYNFT